MLKLQQLLKGVRRRLCGCLGHNFDQSQLVFGKDRIELVCPTCDQPSTGWVLNGKPPTRRFAGARAEPLTGPGLNGQAAGFLFVDGEKIPIKSMTFTTTWTDSLVEQVFAALPDGGDWRGNRNIQ